MKVSSEAALELNDITNPISRAFYEDTRDGLIENIQRYLEILPASNVDIYLNTAYNDGKKKCTPLVIASENGHYHILQLFLETKCRANIEGEGTIVIENRIIRGVTALWIAAANGHFSIVQLLVEHGADVNHTTKTNSSPLRAASYYGYIKIIQYLVDHGSDVHSLNHFNSSHMNIAAYRGHINVVQYLLQSGCNPNIKDNDLSIALHEAVAGGHLKIVKFLLLQYENASNSNITLKNKYNLTPLMVAARHRHLSIVNYLIENNYCTDIECIEALELLGASHYCQNENNPDEGFEYLVRNNSLIT
ncbi:unnamed protein product [Didymodactylos carnosus]|uniref:Ankyrin repeat protein n=1 Tax=Didymodactylos carnosus TaxID=1234261 RepID=A0A815XLE3_9BILA|nr:unnamed protein product [Didymodactylos carnosus]CAF4420383.1 unnamed protein product [Didymodactylos carnosus]